MDSTHRIAIAPTLCIALAVGACASPSASDDVGGTQDTSSNTDAPLDCDESSSQGIDVGMCIPDFTFPDQHGEEFTLWDHRGKVALVDISAIW